MNFRGQSMHTRFSISFSIRVRTSSNLGMNNVFGETGEYYGNLHQNKKHGSSYRTLRTHHISARVVLCLSRQ